MSPNRSIGVMECLPHGLRAGAAAFLILVALPVSAQERAATPPAATSPAPVQPAAPTFAPPAATTAPASPATPPASTSPASASPSPAASPAPPASVEPATPPPASPPQAPTQPAAAAPAASNAEPAGDAPVTLPGVDAGLSANASLPHDLSPWGMFMSADIVVKAVMAGLAFASVVTWTIWFAKVLELAVARRRAQRSLDRLEEEETLAAVEAGRWSKRGPVAALVRVAQVETERSVHLPAEGVKERTAIALQRIEARAGRRMTRGTGLLATIGSTAPFVGLFGTVWGIMNSFIGISQANTTNLAVVAPGIAEALLATAIGLVAAIPAVVVYNVFSRAIAGYRAVLADASAEVLRHLSRDLDRRALARPGSRLQAAE